MARRQIIGTQRDRAERYLIVTIAAFALTVAGVRWYLDLAGYPTVGGGELHVAHVLWGGLALFVAAMLPLLYVGRRSLLLSAVLAGVGVGLFIDEVGKFLTTTNDYFYAPAAPIIYGSILLLVLLWLLVRRRGTGQLDATHALIEAVRDSVDGRLTPQDRDRAVRAMQEADPAADPAGIPAQLMTVLESPAVGDGLSAPGWLASGKMRALLERSLPTRVERWIVLFGLALSALQAVVAIIVLLAWDEVLVGGLEAIPDPSGRLEFPTEPIWSLLMLAIAVVVGLGSAAAISLVRRGRERTAMNVAMVAVLVGLVAGDLVAFYAYQVAALASTLIDLVLLGLIIDYRIRLGQSVESSRPAESGQSVEGAIGDVDGGAD